MHRNGVRGPVGATAVALALAVLGCWAMVSCQPAAAMAAKQDDAAAASTMYDVFIAARTAGGGGGGGGDEVAEGVLGRGRHDRSDSDKKLPFRTGANVRLVSPWLELACDTASDPSPYGPYGPGGGGAADGKWAQRRMLSRADGGDGGDKGLSYPGYDYGGDDDPAESMVWCNASIPDGNPQPYMAGGGVVGVLSAWLGSIVSAISDAAAAALGRKALRTDAVVQPDDGGDATLRNSQWDLDGYVLMGTDFTSPDMFSGSTVFLKNQNTRKFCQVVGGRGSSRLPAGALLCGAMTSGDDTELVVELVEEEEEEEEGRGKKERRRRRRSTKEEQGQQEQEEEEEQGGSWRKEDGTEDDLHYGPDGGGGGDWPGGGGDWPGGGGDDDWPSGGGGDWPGGGGGGDGDKTSVLIRLRAPRNGMRYCAPSRRIRGSPIVCDLSHPDTSHRQLTTFRLVDAAPSYPSGPPRNSDPDPDPESKPKLGSGGDSPAT